ncbi:MAG: domain/EAL protein, partial [Ilumatobacteraceae bacterium]|nr:domain/EAL protein [Ilumatobacteraceae bacterium]
LRVVAEGVETAAQLETLNEARCPFAQGYLWSRPLPATALSGWLTEQGLSNSAGRGLT